MSLRVTKYGLLVIGVGLLLLAGALAGTPRTAAAPLAGITATEPPTPRPTSTPKTPATSTPQGGTPAPTKTPSPRHEQADPAITKSVNVSEAKIGDEVTFTIHVTNNGPGTAEDVVVTDPIPDYMDVIEATSTRGAVSSNGRTVIVTIGRLPATDEVTIRIRVRVNERALPPEGRNIATVRTSSPGDNPNNDTSEVTFKIVSLATPTIVLAEQPTPMPPTASPTVIPSVLPTTGAGEESGVVPLLALAGLIALGLSLVLRSQAARDK